MRANENDTEMKMHNTSVNTDEITTAMFLPLLPARDSELDLDDNESFLASLSRNPGFEESSLAAHHG
jgi:hypothetical protein